MPDSSLQIRVSPGSVRRWLIGAAATVAVLGLVAEIACPRIAPGHAKRVISLFRLDAEWTLASWFSTLLLLLGAVLLGLIAHATAGAAGRFVRHWWVLSIGFTYLALDEAVGLHELATRPVQALAGTSGWLHFAWVIPAAAIVAVIGLAYIPFLRHLSRRTAVLVLAAAALFLGGAIGMELVSGAIVTADEPPALAYALAASLEEILELAGLVLFIHALLDYLLAGLGIRRVVLDHVDLGHAPPPDSRQ